MRTQKKKRQFAVCGTCRRGGFNLRIGFLKPEYQCTLCEAIWAYGYDGGEYFANAMNVGNTKPIDWVEAKDLYRERTRPAKSEAEG